MSTLFEILQNPPPERASDCHISAGRPPSFRLSGELVPIEQHGIVTASETLELANLLLDEEQIEELERDGEIDLSVSAFKQSRCRLNIFKQRGSYAFAFRIMSGRLMSFEEIGLPESVLNLCEQPRGLVLVTGPTGMGKTTTLAAMIDWINRHYKKHIITLEDPIEYAFSHGMSVINQREVGIDTMSFAGALRAALRQDPDVIMLGEMRDLETISTALTAAETGHLVLSTLHTIGSAKTVDRIVDVFPASQQQQIKVQLSMVLQGIISQQLIPAKDGGRVLASEILIPNSAIRNHIRKGNTQQIPNAIQTGGNMNMYTMDTSLISLLEANKITKADALSYCVDPDNMERMIRDKGLGRL